jgi:hypothetical protein
MARKKQAAATSATGSATDRPTTVSSQRSIRTRFDSRDDTQFLPPSSADRSPLMAWRNVPTPTSGSLEHLTLLGSPKGYEEIDVDGEGGSPGNQDEGAHRRKTRTINHITLGFIAYFAVAAGPFGVEDAVRAAGAYPVLLAVVILPFTWGLPQALMVRMDSWFIDSLLWDVLLTHTCCSCFQTNRRQRN